MRTIAAFGYHDQQAPRHVNVCKQLRGEGWNILECHTKRQGFLAKCRDLKMQWKDEQSEADALLVTFPGQYLVPLAWMLTRAPRKRLLFDAFVSVYDSNVTDRGLVSRLNPYAWLLWLADFVSLHLADEVLTNTEADKEFLAKKFFVSLSKIRVIYLGTREDLFGDREARHDNGTLETFFYGSYIPLQGIDVILRAAALLKDRPVHFTLVGTGQLTAAMKSLAKDLTLPNVTFRDGVALSELPEMMTKSDLCLGIFGTTAKALRVIPHKVFDAVAMGKPIITMDSPAIREKFEHDPGVMLVPPGNAEALAQSIIDMTKDVPC